MKGNRGYIFLGDLEWVLSMTEDPRLYPVKFEKFADPDDPSIAVPERCAGPRPTIVNRSWNACANDGEMAA